MTVAWPLNAFRVFSMHYPKHPKLTHAVVASKSYFEVVNQVKISFMPCQPRLTAISGLHDFLALSGAKVNEPA